MNKSSEKLAFSERLKQQLAIKHWPVNSPTWLAREFNIRFNGSPVSVQTASNWLSGSAIPNQDKLQVLAGWLEVSSQWLRFGDKTEIAGSVTEGRSLYTGMRYNLADLPEKLARLNHRQKEAIYCVVEAMLNDGKG
jgi:transcriptional regulator with XRE-family HTH domain